MQLYDSRYHFIFSVESCPGITLSFLSSSSVSFFIVFVVPHPSLYVQIWSICHVSGLHTYLFPLEFSTFPIKLVSYFLYVVKQLTWFTFRFCQFVSSQCLFMQPLRNREWNFIKSNITGENKFLNRSCRKKEECAPMCSVSTHLVHRSVDKCVWWEIAAAGGGQAEVLRDRRDST